MLKAMVFRNFVHFRDKHVLDFRNGHGDVYFIGASSTGKTAVLELLRRCMSSKLNSSVTNRYNEGEHGFVFCQFEIETKDIDGKVITGMIVEGNTESTKVAERRGDGNESESLPGGQKEDDLVDKKKDDDEKEEEWEEDVKFHKIIFYHPRNSKLRIRSKSFFQRGDKCIDSRQNVKLEDSIDSNFSEIEEKLFRNTDTAKFVEYLLETIKKRQSNNDTYNRCPKLWEQISEQYVGILSLRGLGTFQWTRSKYISETFREKNYTGVCEQAEIITDLLDSQKVNHKKEDTIFKFLTYPKVVTFRKKDKEKNEIVVETDGEEFPLLKASVGIVEAKQFALLIAHEGFRTICLEEPDRGMHPQMIERMKEMLYRYCKDKTVIVVTHSPSFIDSVSIEKSFVFFRNKDDSTVCGLTNISRELLENTLKISEIEDWKRILFASRVLLVEGKSDRIVMQAIFRHILQFAQPEKYETLVSHQIVELHGERNFKPLSDICKGIHVPCCAVLDRDKYFTAKDDKIVINKRLHDILGIRDELPLDDFLKEFYKYAQQIEEKENVFIWKDGNLEDLFLSDPDRCKKICNILESNDSKKPEGLKKDYIKRQLNKGLTLHQSKKIGKLLYEYYEVKRLCDFLNKHT